MARYIAKRIILAGFTVWGISVISFVVIEAAPGDWVEKQIEFMELQGTDLSLEFIAALKEDLGVDRHVTVQYVKWIGRIAIKGDFGYSFSGLPGTSGGQRVTDLVAQRLPFTVALTGLTVVLTWTFALPVGVYSAVRHHSIGDYTFSFFGFAGLAVPDFLLGLLLMYVAFAYFDFSVGGLFSGEFEHLPWSWAKFVDMLAHLIIPCVVLGTAGTAGLIRIMRNNLLDELSKPYVVTARAKGVRAWKVIVKYPVRIALNPFLSGIGYLLPGLVGGSIIVSIVLGLPTLGPLMLDAIIFQDIPVAASILLMLGVLTVVGTLISDVLLALVDPRIRLVR